MALTERRTAPPSETDTGTALGRDTPTPYDEVSPVPRANTADRPTPRRQLAATAVAVVFPFIALVMAALWLWDSLVGPTTEASARTCRFAMGTAGSMSLQRAAIGWVSIHRATVRAGRVVLRQQHLGEGQLDRGRVAGEQGAVLLVPLRAGEHAHPGRPAACAGPNGRHLRERSVRGEGGHTRWSMKIPSTDSPDAPARSR